MAFAPAARFPCQSRANRAPPLCARSIGSMKSRSRRPPARTSRRGAAAWHAPGGGAQPADTRRSHMALPDLPLPRPGAPIARTPSPRDARSHGADARPPPWRSTTPASEPATRRRIHAVIDCRHNGDTSWPATPNTKPSGERTAPIALLPKFARGAALASLRRLALDAVCAARPLRSVSNWTLQATRARRVALAVFADDGPTRRNDEVQHGRAGPAHRAS